MNSSHLSEGAESAALDSNGTHSSKLGVLITVPMTNLPWVLFFHAFPHCGHCGPCGPCLRARKWCCTPIIACSIENHFFKRPFMFIYEWNTWLFMVYVSVKLLILDAKSCHDCNGRLVITLASGAHPLSLGEGSSTATINLWVNHHHKRFMFY